ncbi:mitochondrial RNA binding complex 1 subunit [Novymonas esmeraldas]|uniref:Mitochondrial RNA binding complex 1 subunit n=1 Tax=Novymonas esmeraldas TaxID=1808958 RepID=A0AAW0EWE8_9TRYP
MPFARQLAHNARVRALAASAHGSDVCCTLRCASAASSLVRAASASAVAGAGSSGSGSSTGCHHAAQWTARRWQSFGGGSGFFADESSGLQSELSDALEGEGNLSTEAMLSQTLEKADLRSPSARIRLQRIEQPPGRFDLLTNSLVYRWLTTAAQARKVSGPMREWASELKYRTGVHLEVEPTNPSRLALSEEEGGYAVADEVELTVYLFGSERGIFNCRQLMESALDQEPAYVRLAVFRRKPGQATGTGTPAAPRPDEDVEWLVLRRINRDLRPPDIPPISLKTPGKWTLLYEQHKEAAIRTLWEETGITIEPGSVYPTAVLYQDDPLYYWRVPVHYFLAEVPYDVHVAGPQVGQNTYMHHWDASLLRQSPDPIDRTWAQWADPETGCAWLRRPVLDELQRPLRGDNYMAIRYTPPPYSGLNDALGFAVPSDAAPSTPNTGAEQPLPEGESPALPDASPSDEKPSS